MSSTSTSSSDSDSEIIQYITRRRRRTNIRVDQMLIEDSEFLCRYRINKTTAHYICSCIEREVRSNTPRNNALSVPEQLLLALRFYATCSMQQVVGDISRVHKTSVCRAIHRVSKAIAALAPRYIYMPRNTDEMSTVTNDFYRIAKFPRVIGAIDCTHVPIQSPGAEHAELYRCRKDFFSLNVQTIVNAKLKIMDIVCRWPGSVHDSTIFDHSYIKERLENGEFGERHLLGDGGYPQRSYIMIPFRAPRNVAEENYNRSHIKTRNIVERSFGVWKRRFPCLGLKLRVHRKNMEAIIVATAVLYNIGRDLNEPWDSEDLSLLNEEPALPLPVAPTISGVTARNNLVQDFFTN